MNDPNCAAQPAQSMTQYRMSKPRKWFNVIAACVLLPAMLYVAARFVYTLIRIVVREW